MKHSFVSRGLPAILAILICALPVFAQDKGTIAPDQIPGSVVYIPYPVAIELDGKLDDWKGIPVQKVDKGPSIGPDKKQNQSVDFAVAADEKNLYVYMRSVDSNIIAGKHGADFWNEDSMEFYVNFSKNLNTRSYSSGVMQVTINATNIGKTKADKLSLSGTNGAGSKATGHVFKTADGWAFETALPLPKGFKVDHGVNIGFQVHANGASAKDRDSKLIWSKQDTDDLSYQNPSLFGRGVFFKVGSADVPEAKELGMTLAQVFKKEGAKGKAGKKLAWTDEFDAAGAPDAAKWAYDAADSGKYNQELQLYTESRENSFAKDGILTIRALKDKAGKWTSARLYTKGKADWTYGYFEVKAKLPTGVGTWPAIWMMPANDSYGDWPASGEIDIMEFVGFDPDKVHTSVHTKSYNHRISTQQTRSSKVPGVSSDFHTYAMEWSEKGIFFYVDDQPFYLFLNDGKKNSATWPFDKPFFMILNVAMGGSWGGMKGMDESLNQAEMLVDYVRVYR